MEARKLPVSIREVAAMAGVSLGTVSKVLNDSVGAQIATPTRERVRRAALELGYHPSAVARALVRKQMDAIGVVLPPGTASPIRSPFFSGLFDAVLEAAARYHQNTTVFTGHTWQNAAVSLPRFRDGRCDGLLLFYQPPQSDIVTALLDAGVPTVLINDTRDDPRLSSVDVDNVASARIMTEHLLSLGHRRIGMVCGVMLNYVPPRVAGYRLGLESAGIPFDPALAPGDFGLKWGDDVVGRQLDALLALPADRRPTALFCANDEIASCILRLLLLKGVRVPSDLSVAGFNDDVVAGRQMPPLTTLRQPYNAIAERAVALLLEQVADVTARGRKEAYPTELIVRDSTAAPPA